MAVYDRSYVRYAGALTPEWSRFLVLPRYALMPPGGPPSLKVLPVDLPNAGGTVSIVTLKNRTLSPLADLFVKTARAVTKTLVRK